jgi:hypothetical protein
LRAKAIGQPRGDEIARLLEQYTKLRIAFVQAEHNPAELDKLNGQTNALQSTIWGHLSAIIRDQPNPATASLMASLNDVFDMSTAERFAFDQPLPTPVFWLLIGLTVLGMGVLGYQWALQERRVRMLVAVLALAWTAVIVVILDLAAPRVGNLRTSVTAYEWTIQGFQGGPITIPPPPTR